MNAITRFTVLHFLCGLSSDPLLGYSILEEGKSQGDQAYACHVNRAIVKRATSPPIIFAVIGDIWLLSFS
jgi:hypothetical protein